jgi:hypothetical protein
MSKSSMTKVAVLLVLVSPALLLFGVGSDSGNAKAAPPQDGEKSLIERGRYLVTIASCNDCHTPFKMGPNGPEPDMSRMLSGTPEGMKLTPVPKPEGSWMWSGDMTGTIFAGPWGVTYAHNLTPDTETGLGAWTPEIFIQAMRTGKHMGKGEPILPPMPWMNIGKATDEDLRAIFAYLQSIPPIRNQAPTHQMAPMGK